MGGRSKRGRDRRAPTHRGYDAAAVAELEGLYAQLPTVECKGLCHDSCTVAPASELERRRVANAGGALLTDVPVTADGRRRPRCPCLSVRNRCTVYRQRPLICRVFGVADGMPCSYGCQPSAILPGEEFMRIMVQIEQLSRRITGVQTPPPQF